MLFVILIVALIVAVASYIAIKLTQLTFEKILLITIGLSLGALIGLLISLPLSKLPPLLGTVLPITLPIVFALTMAVVFYMQHKYISHFFSRGGKTNKSLEKNNSSKVEASILVDTSAIIDGRIADIARAGFVPGKLLVPRFVLAELQNIADSENSMRRGRGRRGLEMLNLLRQNEAVSLDIIEEDPKQIKEVDHKLVYLARKYKTNILTTDYNLNRVATIETVRVLNINELSNAIRPVVLPGEEMIVKVVQAGKEKGQGVGYLPDGTMIVVENGDKLIGKEVTTEVTRIFQTVAGKMIFAAEKKPKHETKTRTNSQRKANKPLLAKRLRPNK